jgi:hypothetical protein
MALELCVDECEDLKRTISAFVRVQPKRPIKSLKHSSSRHRTSPKRRKRRTRRASFKLGSAILCRASPFAVILISLSSLIAHHLSQPQHLRSTTCLETTSPGLLTELPVPPSGGRSELIGTKPASSGRPASSQHDHDRAAPVSHHLAGPQLSTGNKTHQATRQDSQRASAAVVLSKQSDRPHGVDGGGPAAPAARGTRPALLGMYSFLDDVAFCLSLVCIIADRYANFAASGCVESASQLGWPARRPARGARR